MTAMAADAHMIGRLIDRDPDRPGWARRQHGDPWNRTRRATKRGERQTVRTFIRRYNDNP